MNPPRFGGEAILPRVATNGSRNIMVAGTFLRCQFAPPLAAPYPDFDRVFTR
jgi:hypothetical protein